MHRFQRGRSLMLGGVRIPFSKGLAGHSDADVLLHAICDALLGALGEPDIGHQFPPGDPRYKNRPSSEFVRIVMAKVRKAKWRVANVDTVLIGEEPKVAPHRDRIRCQMARLLQVATSQVNLKATTAEGLGWLGQKRGLAASAVVLLQQ